MRKASDTERKPISIERGDAPYFSLYVRYSKAPVARTMSLDGDAGLVNLDVDAEGEVVGLEAAITKPKQIEMLARIAQERKLGLDGVFAASTTGRRAASRRTP
jgi:uncharacterized protein YuzE